MKFFNAILVVGILAVLAPQVYGDQASSPDSFTAEAALPQASNAKDVKTGMDEAVREALEGRNSALAQRAGEKTATTQGALAADKNVTTGTTAKTDGESQPVFNETLPQVEKKPAPAKNLWLRMLGSLTIALVLFGGGLYGFKHWPGSKKLSARARMIEVLSQHHLGPKKSLAVVRVAGETCLIGITDNNISILKTLSLLDEDLPKEGAAKKENTDEPQFQKKILAEYVKSPEKAAYYTRSGATAPEVKEKEDEFSMQGLREIVGEKLKTMKEL